MFLQTPFLLTLIMISLILSFTKLVCSNKILMMIICIEMIMSGLFMSWVLTDLIYDQGYYYIMFFCMIVMEGAMGVSIVVSMLTMVGCVSPEFTLSKL